MHYHQRWRSAEPRSGYRKCELSAGPAAAAMAAGLARLNENMANGAGGAAERVPVVVAGESHFVGGDTYFFFFL